MSHDVSLNFDWAHRAYDAYCAELPLEVREQLRKPAGEAFVVLYGPTQVGKTTLILTMLQLSEDGHARVGKTLRGKRKKGESSTAVATQYRRSKNENWSFSWQGRHITASSDEEMTTALEQLRRSMMKGDIEASDDYCTINIPLSYFKPQEEGEGKQKTIRILDLPGIEADSEEEKKYVRAISRKFVPIATLTLLVSKADDLGFFFKGLDGVPEIKHWMNTPGRFRVVTTYSFTPETVRKTVKKKQGNIKEYQKELIAQIGTFGTLPERAQKDELYYPLEFGASWQESDLRKETQVLDDMIKKEFKRLYDDIAQADDPLNYLLSVLDSQGCTEAFYEERYKVINDKINSFRNKVKHEKKIIETLNNKLKDAEKRMKRNEIGLDALQFLSEEMIAPFWVDYEETEENNQKAMSNLLQKQKWSVPDLKKFTTLHTIEEKETEEKELQALLPLVASLYDDWVTSCLKNIDLWLEGIEESEELDKSLDKSHEDDEIWFAACSHFFNTLPSAEYLLRDARSFILLNFKEVVGRLDEYWMDSYWFDSSYQEDCLMFMQAYKRSAARLKEKISQSLDAEQKCFEEKIRKKKNQAETDVKMFGMQKSKRELELASLEQQLEESVTLKKQVDAEWREIKEKTDNMCSFFQEEYLKEVSDAYDAVYATKEAGLSFYRLCQAQTLKESRHVIEEKLFR